MALKDAFNQWLQLLCSGSTMATAAWIMIVGAIVWPLLSQPVLWGGFCYGCFCLEYGSRRDGVACAFAAGTPNMLPLSEIWLSVLWSGFYSV